MPQTALPLGRKAVLWTIRVVLGLMAFPTLVFTVYAIVESRQKHPSGLPLFVATSVVLWTVFFALYLTGMWIERRK